MGKLTKKRGVQNTVRPELAEALKDLMSMGINIVANSLLRDVDNPMYKRSDGSTKSNAGSAHSTGAAIDWSWEDNPEFVKFLFGDSVTVEPGMDKEQIADALKNATLSEQGAAWCKKHNITILDEYNMPNYDGGKPGGRRHFHMEVQTRDGNTRGDQGKGRTKIESEHDEDFNERQEFKRLRKVKGRDGVKRIENNVLYKSQYWGTNSNQFVENEYNTSQDYIDNIQQDSDDFDPKVGIKNQVDIETINSDTTERINNGDIYVPNVATTESTNEDTTTETTNNQITIVVENNRDFKENPITDEEIRNTVNYNLDSDQLKQDFKDGKLPYNSLFIHDGDLYKKGFDDAVHEYDRESRTFDDQRQFPIVINDLENVELPEGQTSEDVLRKPETTVEEDDTIDEIGDIEEEFEESVQKPNRLEYPLNPNVKSEGNINPDTKGQSYNEALELYNEQARQRKEREERLRQERETTTVTPSDNEVVTVEGDETQETKEAEQTQISIEEVVKNDYMNDMGYTSEDQLTEEDKEFIALQLETASLEEETVRNQVQDKLRGDTYLQEKYADMDINDIIMSPTFGNDFADIYDNIVVGDTEQKTVENETTGTVETTGDIETTEFEGERYGDSEREILDYIFQASDEDLDKLKQLKKDRNFITKNKVGNDKILKAADEDTAGSGKVTSEQYYELDSSLRNDYIEVIDWNTGESFYIKTDWINRSEGQRANDLRRKRESGSITAEEIEELQKLDSGYHSRDILTRADVYMNTEGHPGGQTKQYTGGLEEVNQFINNRRTLIIETGKDPEIQLSPEQTEIYNKVIDENYDESNLETDFEIFYNQPISYRAQIIDDDGRITYEGEEFLTTPTDVTTTVTEPPTTDTDKQQIPPVVTESVRTLGDIGQEVLKGTMAAARGVLDAFGGPDALVSAVMGKKALGVAMQDLNPQEKAKLSPMFNEQLRQSKELTKRGFHPSQERKIRKDISQAYNQGLDNAVRGTAGDRAKFLATSGILDRNRASALLEFAALDSQQQIANQDRYNQLLQFKETFDAQQKESLRSENLELALANKKAASQFAGIALGDTMSRLSDLADNEINRALKNEMFNRYNYMFNTDKTNPYLTSTINPE